MKIEIFIISKCWTEFYIKISDFCVPMAFSPSHPSDPVFANVACKIYHPVKSRPQDSGKDHAAFFRFFSRVRVSGIMTGYPLWWIISTEIPYTSDTMAGDTL